MERLTRIQLRVEPVWGAEVGRMIADMIELADRLGIEVVSKHNDIDLCVAPGETLETCLRRYRNTLEMLDGDDA